ncbi:MAG TPA: sigma-54 dependent transcriptional regulator [Thermoanaerobaculia bacterium]|nr:sigma-54 dependent transcriptional regulator [Thermoanaerobaculia bacterium]
MPHALIVDDDEDTRSALAELVEGQGFTVTTAGALVEARSKGEERIPDVVLVDLVLPDGDGMDLLEAWADNGHDTDVVLITGHASVDTAVEALRQGATDYLVKPIDFSRLEIVLANIARTRELRGEIADLRRELRSLGRFGDLVGVSAPIQEVFDLVEKVAPTDASVMLTGESGTGKELVAATIHRLSDRRKGPFVPLNCSATSATLIESELFGHERGSFTGANRQHKGIFEQASGGTLFLDEITEMPIELQAKLLRVLESRSFNRIGGERPIAADVRIVAASNRDLGEAVKEGKLREDLLYRLNVFPIELPPLRRRGDDVKLLADHFLRELNREKGTGTRLAPAAMERLGAYSWPGNVRELRNVIARAYILAGEEIGIESLPPEVVGTRGADPGATSEEPPAGDGVRVAVGSSIADVERRLILATLDSLDGDKRAAAEQLGISLKTLYNRLKTYRA